LVRGKQMTEKYKYDVFGAVTIRDSENSVLSVLSVSSVANPYMFTGRRYDNETGLYYYRARYYDHYTGRFLQTAGETTLYGGPVAGGAAVAAVNWLTRIDDVSFNLSSQHYLRGSCSRFSRVDWSC